MPSRDNIKIECNTTTAQSTLQCGNHSTTTIKDDSNLCIVKQCTMCTLLVALYKKLKSQKNTFPWTKNIVEVFFLCSFKMKNLKIVWFFYLPLLETLFLELSKSGKITRKSQKIANLEFENHKNLKFSIFGRVVRAGKKYIYTNIV